VDQSRESGELISEPGCPAVRRCTQTPFMLIFTNYLLTSAFVLLEMWKETN
jgi:hypothetical protein